MKKGHYRGIVYEISGGNGFFGYRCHDTFSLEGRVNWAKMGGIGYRSAEDAEIKAKGAIDNFRFMANIESVHRSLTALETEMAAITRQMLSKNRQDLVSMIESLSPEEECEVSLEAMDMNSLRDIAKSLIAEDYASHMALATDIDRFMDANRAEAENLGLIGHDPDSLLVEEVLGTVGELAEKGLTRRLRDGSIGMLKDAIEAAERLHAETDEEKWSSSASLLRGVVESVCMQDLTIRDWEIAKKCSEVLNEVATSAPRL